jgi:hypothetical protein
MASYSVNLAKHATSSAATVDTVTLALDFPYVEVVNVSGTDAIYVCVDGVGGPAGDGVPTVAGNDTYVVAKGIGASLRVPSPTKAGSVVKLISTLATGYAVQGVAD